MPPALCILAWHITRMPTPVLSIASRLLKDDFLDSGDKQFRDIPFDLTAVIPHHQFAGERNQADVRGGLCLVQLENHGQTPASY